LLHREGPPAISESHIDWQNFEDVESRYWTSRSATCRPNWTLPIFACSARFRIAGRVWTPARMQAKSTYGDEQVGRVLTCVRPQVAAFKRRGPKWESADQVQHAYTHSRCPSGRWFSRSRLIDRLSISAVRPAFTRSGGQTKTFPPEPTSSRCRLVGAASCHQSPSDAGHPIGECDDDQHWRLSADHPRQPGFFGCAMPRCPAQNCRSTDDE
jgi:hypothetical protein